MSPKRILNVESSYLPKCTKLFKRLFRKQDPVSNFTLTGSCIEGA